MVLPRHLAIGRGACRDVTRAVYGTFDLDVARYVASLADQLKISSIRRLVVAISQQHQERGFDPPTAHKLVREVVAGITRTHGSVQKQKTALSAELLAGALR